MPLSPRTLRPSSSFTPRSIPGLALWLDASAAGDLYTTDAGPVTAVTAPTDISGCVGWYDSADLSALRQNSDGTGTVAAGDPVGWWKDKSATGANVTAAGSARPTLSATGFNGRQALVFNGSSTNLSSAAGYTAQNGLSGMTRIAVCSHANQLGALSRVWNGGGDFFMQMNSGLRATVADGANFVTAAVPGATGSSAPAGLYSDVFASSAIAINNNGASLPVTVNGTITATTGSGSPTLHIGSNIGANFFWNGPIAEYIIFNRDLTRAELARVEAYLAAKWGIAGVHAAATAASDPVGYWRDRSGSDNFTQASSSSRPTVGSLGGKRSVLFDGVNDWLEAVAPLSTSMPLTMFIAQRIVAGTSFGMTYAAATGFNVRQTGATSGITVLVPGAGTGTGASRTGSSDILAITYPSSGNNTLSVNGASFALDDTASRPTLTGTHSIGIRRNADGTTNFPANVAVSEIIAYSTALTATQRRQVERYLAAKYGITLAPQVANADAQDWINRVYANGGTVSSATAAAVNTFCDSVTNASLRDRFYRLNLFCGTGLNAALVPLYRGPSIGGTQYGNTTDTNNAFVGVGTDYAETGASGGLTGNGSTKYLATGLNLYDAGVTETGFHASGYFNANTSTTGVFLGCLNSTNTRGAQWYPAYPNVPLGMYLRVGGVTNSGLENAVVSSRMGHLIGCRRPDGVGFLNGANINGTSITSGSGSWTASSSTPPLYVFARNDAQASPSLQHFAGRCCGYSVGLALTDAQAAAFYTAMQAFQTAMGRQV